MLVHLLRNLTVFVVLLQYLSVQVIRLVVIIKLLQELVWLLAYRIVSRIACAELILQSFVQIPRFVRIILLKQEYVWMLVHLLRNLTVLVEPLQYLSALYHKIVKTIKLQLEIAHYKLVKIRIIHRANLLVLLGFCVRLGL